MSRYYSDDAAQDAANWEDDEEARYHKFDQECYHLSLKEKHDPTAFNNFAESVSFTPFRNIAILEDLLIIAEDTHSEKDLAALGRFLLESSREYQMELIKEIVRGG